MLSPYLRKVPFHPFPTADAQHDAGPYALNNYPHALLTRSGPQSDPKYDSPGWAIEWVSDGLRLSHSLNSLDGYVGGILGVQTITPKPHMENPNSWSSSRFDGVLQAGPEGPRRADQCLCSR